MTDWKFERAAQAHRDRQLDEHLNSLEPRFFCPDCETEPVNTDGELCHDCQVEDWRRRSMRTHIAEETARQLRSALDASLRIQQSLTRQLEDCLAAQASRDRMQEQTRHCVRCGELLGPDDDDTCLPCEYDEDDKQ
jgi:hypothetical protein